MAGEVLGKPLHHPQMYASLRLLVDEPGQGGLKLVDSGEHLSASQYLSELEQLEPEQRPLVGSSWPSHGLFIPDHAALRDSIARLANNTLLLNLLEKTAF